MPVLCRHGNGRGDKSSPWPVGQQYVGLTLPFSSRWQGILNWGTSDGALQMAEFHTDEHLARWRTTCSTLRAHRIEGTHRMPRESQTYWTHFSVIGLAKDRDPIEVVVDEARRLVLSAMESGWAGPPFNPFALAEHLGIPVLPRDGIQDARMVPASRGPRFQIEYNPNRPIARIRYSIAHEMAQARVSRIPKRELPAAPRQRSRHSPAVVGVRCPTTVQGDSDSLQRPRVRRSWRGDGREPRVAPGDDRFLLFKCGR